MSGLAVGMNGNKNLHDPFSVVCFSPFRLGSLPMVAFQTPKKTSDPFDILRESLDAESWDWLSETLPGVAEGVSVAVVSKQSPGDIRRFVAGQTGRLELALRCEQAARHLQRMANN